MYYVSSYFRRNRNGNDTHLVKCIMLLQDAIGRHILYYLYISCSYMHNTVYMFNAQCVRIPIAGRKNIIYYHIISILFRYVTAKAQRSINFITMILHIIILYCWEFRGLSEIVQCSYIPI